MGQQETEGLGGEPISCDWLGIAGHDASLPGWGAMDPTCCPMYAAAAPGASAGVGRCIQLASKESRGGPSPRLVKSTARSPPRGRFEQG
jgi:hypothetical protein